MKTTFRPAPATLAPDGSLTLTLPLPARAVSPNARRGESKGAAIRKSRAVKVHRFIAATILRNFINTHPHPLPPFTGYRLAFYFKTAAFRDDDNADASVKPYRDGLADVLQIDDRGLRKLALSTHAKDAQNPRLELTLIP
jgi:hypothetical protein